VVGDVCLENDCRTTTTRTPTLTTTTLTTTTTITTIPTRGKAGGGVVEYILEGKEDGRKAYHTGTSTTIIQTWWWWW